MNRGTNMNIDQVQSNYQEKKQSVEVKNAGGKCKQGERDQVESMIR